MPPKPKTEQEREQLRTLIIDNARDLFVSKGIEAVTMREIAKRIGYSATSIYLHFADKEAVLRAICDTDFLKLATTLKEILSIEDPVARMVAFGEGYAKFALAFPNHYRLMFMTPHLPYSQEQSDLQRNNAEQDAYFQLKMVVHDVYAAGGFKSELHDAELIAQTIWAAIHGVCALQIIMAQDDWVEWRPIDTRLSMMQQLMLSGLLKEKNE
ncbi:MAG: TetR family transcriptional regulator [Methylophilales bacterium 28-44-11]|jgi:AcrR family transcriptional regulator|nr:MAG: TetR family transcriptional regulator [Methylophilales bacterium 28-44-11]OYY97054.1 MAG: TetR family transcriptional regulator [Methylophilales bacterium 16-45-7]